MRCVSFSRTNATIDASSMRNSAFLSSVGGSAGGRAVVRRQQPICINRAVERRTAFWAVDAVLAGDGIPLLVIVGGFNQRVAGVARREFVVGQLEL